MLSDNVKTNRSLSMYLINEHILKVTFLNLLLACPSTT